MMPKSTPKSLNMSLKISAKIGVENNTPKANILCEMMHFGPQFWTHLHSLFPVGRVFLGTPFATPSQRRPWDDLGTIFDGFGKHLGQIYANFQRFGKHFGPDLGGFGTKLQANLVVSFSFEP